MRINFWLPVICCVASMTLERSLTLLTKLLIKQIMMVTSCLENYSGTMTQLRINVTVLACTFSQTSAWLSGCWWTFSVCFQLNEISMGKKKNRDDLILQLFGAESNFKFLKTTVWIVYLIMLTYSVFNELKDCNFFQF